jgi:hypothetical protein
LAYRAAEIQDLLGDNFSGLDKLKEVSEVQFLERVGEDAKGIMYYLKCQMY